MNLIDALPDRIVSLMRSGSIAQYATVSAAGVPIDTPVLYFPGENPGSFNLTTGLSYPAKAERARRNPKVGLLLEGGPDEPVISIAGMAAVRDADLQGNVNRYLAEACYTLPHNPGWPLARQAVWYWTRIIVEIAPARILWWDSPAHMDKPPQRWDMPDDVRYPQSDAAPPGKSSQPATWDERPWRELAGQALARTAPGHLSVLDAEGFPLPMRVRAMAPSESGFVLTLPAGVPWKFAGKACLTFGGIETFLGDVTSAQGAVHMTIARALPVFPMTSDMKELWEPAPGTRQQLMRRLEEELRRRGQSVPLLPEVRPQPSEGYRLRMKRMGRTPV
jgi:hypothetical protein